MGRLIVFSRRATRKSTTVLTSRSPRRASTAFCTPGDIALLPRVLASAEPDRPLDDDERRAAVEAMAAEELIFPMPR